ncbi:caspase family protein [uncultured Chloroflexus sp.]|uniref:caspase family protein n=1 Tax=uncultured Chloroflexus sp. TaxID=214040 RepID=UPI002610BF89|nr:caspase family protein [uncultured Chloroflexus sp.]
MTSRPSLPDRCFAVCVGVNEYNHVSGLSALRYAENDARAMDALLNDLGVPPEHRRLLCGTEATLANVTAALDELFVDRAGVNDFLVFYFAGHGVPVSFDDGDPEVFLASWDFDYAQLQKKSFRINQSLSLQRLRRDYFEGEGARKRLFILDSCYSGDFLGPGYRDNGVTLVLSEVRRLLPGNATGRAALAACLPNKLAREDDQLRHGRMTYYVLQALYGHAPDAREPDGWVTIQSLHSYLDRNLAPFQRPVLSGQFTRMPLVHFEPPAQSTPLPPLDRGAYLQRLIELNQQIDLRGLGGPVQKLPLERVYVALKADAAPPAERRAAAGYVEQLVLSRAPDTSDPYLQRALIRQTLARGDPIALNLLRRSVDGDATSPDGRPSRLNLGELLARERWAVLLGDPGAGKTTLLRWTALTFAQALLAGRERVVVPAVQVYADEENPDQKPDVDLGAARLPVLLRLADYEAARWADGRDTSLTIAAFLGRQPWLGQPLFAHAEQGERLLHQALTHGQALILCDGLDEIADQTRRGRVVDALTAFIHEYVRDPVSGYCPVDEDRNTDWTLPAEHGGNQILITSRIVGYYLAPLPATIPHYTVAELSEVAIRRFCTAWGSAVAVATGDADLPARVATLAQALVDRQRPDLRELAGNPLLLTALIAQYGAAPTDLPRRRVELYDRVTDAFLRHRPDALVAIGMKHYELRYALAQVALRLHADADHPTGFVSYDELHDWLTTALKAIAPSPERQRRARIDAEAIITYVREAAGLFMERGEGIYAFLHRSFQEYFAALALSWDDTEAAQAITARLDDPAWHEVLILAIANLSRTKQKLTTLMWALINAPEPAPGILPRNALFIARCVGELITPPPAEVVAEAVVQLVTACAPHTWPATIADDTPAPLRAAVVTALKQLWSQSGAVKGMVQVMTDPDPARRFAAIDLLLECELTHPDLVPVLIVAGRDFVEPTAILLKAIERYAEVYPTAFTPALLPVRRWLHAGDDGIDPAWRMLIRAVYSLGWRAPDVPLNAAEVMLDSPLTPLLEPLWQRRAAPADLITALETYRASTTDHALMRDVALALSILTGADWRDLPLPVQRAVAGRIIQRWLTTIARLEEPLFHTLYLNLNLDLVRTRDRATDFDLSLDFARSRAYALSHAPSRYVRVPDRPYVRTYAFARAYACAAARARIRAAARARIRAAARARIRAAARARIRARAIAHTLVRFHAIVLAFSRAIDRARTLDGDLDHALARVRIRAHTRAQALILARTRARALARTRVRTRARGRARALARILILTRVRAHVRARARNLLNTICVLIGQYLDRALVETGVDHVSIAQAQAALPDVRALVNEHGVSEWQLAVDVLANQLVQPDGAVFDGRRRLTLSADVTLPLTTEQHAALALPNEVKKRRAVLAQVRGWLTSADPVARASAGLLLLEAGERTPESVAAALDLLTSPHDLFRYRAYRVLVRDSNADEWSLSAIERLAQVAQEGHTILEGHLRTMYAGWALQRIEYTDAAWITDWIARSDAGDRVSRYILGSIHRLAEGCWPPLLDNLRIASPDTQAAILTSLYWLLQATPPRHPHLSATVDVLLGLSAAPSPVSAMALRALGSARALSADQTAQLCQLVELSEPPAALWATLARLSSLPNTDTIAVTLAAAPDIPAVRAARVRRAVQQGIAAKRQAISLAELTAIVPKPADCLAALLAAGADEDRWSDYHERIADAIRDLLAIHDCLLPELLARLRNTDAGWPAQRIALAALARCATAMPEWFNALAASSDLVSLLLSSAVSQVSFDARRFAITALAALREITGEVLTALFRLVGDIVELQNDIIDAARRFNRLHRDLGERLPDELVQALTGESAVRAYVAAQVLEALGTSTATMITPGLRRQIVALLADALRDPRSRRSVWRWNGSDIEEAGTLNQSFYRALLRVAGFKVEKE